MLYIKGEPAYSKLIEDENRKQAELLMAGFKETVNNYVKNVDRQIQSYNLLKTNVDNIKTLANTLKTKETTSTSYIADTSMNIAVNNRKSYYEEEGVDGLTLWYQYLAVIYYMIFCVYIFKTLRNQDMTMTAKLISIGLWLLLPYIVNVLIWYVYLIWTNTEGWLPQDTYWHII
jgi:hypothetical protein